MTTPASERITEIANAIRAARYPDAAVVFAAGSIVRGEATPYSDLDLVVVYPRLACAARESFRHDGYPVEAFLHDPETLEWAIDQGPYDVIFIDADHTYEGVKKDWEDYGPLAERVAFHDIVFSGVGHGVHKLWPELSKDHSTQECVMSFMGTGIVKRA